MELVCLDNVYRMMFTNEKHFNNVIKIDIYEFDIPLYSMKLSAKEFTSLIIGIGQPGPIHLGPTFFGDKIEIQPIDADYCNIIINNRFSLGVDKQKITDIFSRIFIDLSKMMKENNNL